jgi:quercetin dioxygenase-like cupin family protein
VIVSDARRQFARLSGRDSADPFAGMPAEGLSMRIVRLTGTGTRSPHRHPLSQEAIYVISGRGALWEDGQLQSFEAGDCALIEAGVPHATIPDGGTSMELVCFFPHPDLNANLEELEDTVIRPHGEGDDA